MLGFPGLFIAANRPFDVSQRLVSGNEDLEALEEAPRLGGLGAGVAEQDIRPNPDLPEALEQSRMEGKGHEPLRGFERAERSEAPLVSAPPSALELVAWGLPLVKPSLPYLPPTLQAAHLHPPRIFRISQRQPG